MEAKKHSERQAHGFRFESQVVADLNLIPETSYTAKWDAYDTDDTPISIKCISLTGTIDCGSVVRMFEHFSSPGWDMIVGRHVNKVLKAVYRYSFTKEVCDALIGDLTVEDVRAFDENIKSFEQGRHTEARAYAKSWKATHKSQTGLLTVQPKIDSKTQRRVQCGINRTALNKLFSPMPYEGLHHLIGVDFGN